MNALRRARKSWPTRGASSCCSSLIRAPVLWPWTGRCWTFPICGRRNASRLRPSRPRPDVEALVGAAKTLLGHVNDMVLGELRQAFQTELRADAGLLGSARRHIHVKVHMLVYPHDARVDLHGHLQCALRVG